MLSGHARKSPVNSSNKREMSRDSSNYIYN